MNKCYEAGTRSGILQHQQDCNEPFFLKGDLTWRPSFPRTASEEKRHSLEESSVECCLEDYMCLVADIKDCSCRVFKGSSGERSALTQHQNHHPADVPGNSGAIYTESHAAPSVFRFPRNTQRNTETFPRPELSRRKHRHSAVTT